MSFSQILSELLTFSLKGRPDGNYSFFEVLPFFCFSLFFLQFYHFFFNQFREIGISVATAISVFFWAERTEMSQRLFVLGLISKSLLTKSCSNPTLPEIETKIFGTDPELILNVNNWQKWQKIVVDRLILLWKGKKHYFQGFRAP